MSESLKTIRIGIDHMKVESKKRKEAENASSLSRFLDKRKSFLVLFTSSLSLSFSPPPSFLCFSLLYLFFVFSCLPLLLPFHLSPCTPD